MTVNTTWYAEYAADKAAKDAEAARKKAQHNRDEALQGMTYTFSDGRVIQVRPQDEPNFMRQISKGEGRKWILADNSTAFVSLAELQEAAASGEAQGAAIYDEYIATLEAL